MQANIVKKPTPPQQKPPTKPASEAETTIKELADIKANMVPKSDYEKALAEKDKFKNALIKGISIKDDEPYKTRGQLAKEMAAYNSGNVTNLKYIDTALKLRQATIDETGKDPFQYPDAGEGAGERIADGLQRMVDEADGRSEAFLGIYQAGVRDEKLMPRAK